MFAVLFEVQPRRDQWDAYLGHAKALRPDLEAVEGFVENIRYASLTRPGWLLSLSTWADEKALVRWRTQAGHHDVQARGRDHVLADYHLRVGQITADSDPPAGLALDEQRLDETEVGEATTVSLITARRPADLPQDALALAVAERLGLACEAAGLVAWDVYEAVLTPGELILMLAWRDRVAAETFEAVRRPAPYARSRRVRIVRDYGMFDRREAPQYYPEALRRNDEPDGS